MRAGFQVFYTKTYAEKNVDLGNADDRERSLNKSEQILKKIVSRFVIFKLIDLFL